MIVTVSAFRSGSQAPRRGRARLAWLRDARPAPPARARGRRDGHRGSELMTSRRRPRWLLDAERVDHAIYAAVAATPTPSLDRFMIALSHAADGSVLWIATASALALARGPRGRRAAGAGLASIAVTSAAVNLVAKPLARRRRPDRI